MEEKDENVVDDNVNLENQDVINNQQNYDMPKKKGGFPVIGIVIGLVVLVFLGALGFVIFSKVLLNNKKIVEMEVSTVFKNIKEFYKEAEKSQLKIDADKDAIGFEGNLKVDSNYKANGIDLTKLKDYEINYNGVLDKKGNELSAAFQLSNSKNIIDLALYGEKDKMYIDLKDLYKKVIEMDLDSEIKDIKITEVDSKDIEKIIDKTEKTTKEYIDGKDITKKKEKKKINGVEKNYTTIIYRMDTNKYLKKVLESYRYDEDILEILANLTNQKKFEVEKQIKDLENNLDDYTDNTEVEVKTYIDGLIPSVKAVEFESEGSSILIEYVKDKAIITGTVEGKKAFYGDYDYKTKELVLDSEVDGTKGNITLKLNDINNIKGSFTWKMSGVKLGVDLESLITVKRNVQTSEMKINVTYNAGSENFKANIISKMELSKKAEVEKVDTKNTIKTDEMTDSDINSIMSKFYQKVGTVVTDVAPGLIESYVLS